MKWSIYTLEIVSFTHYSIMNTFIPSNPYPEEEPPSRPSGLSPMYEYLDGGAFGNVYISTNGTTVVKIPSNEQVDLIGEYNTLCALQKLAPDYLPSPCMLTKIGKKTALQMGNAGITFSNSLPLTGVEYALCILQSIHFLLLINDEFSIQDLHYGNLCLRWRGPDIRMRFIDVGMWERRPGSIMKNTYELFCDGSFSFWTRSLIDSIERVPDPLTGKLLRVIQKTCECDSIQDLKYTNVYGMLMLLASHVRECLDVEYDVKDLMTQIENAYHTSVSGCKAAVGATYTDLSRLFRVQSKPVVNKLLVTTPY